MFWFDKEDDRVVFGDIRYEGHMLPDVSTKGGFRKLEIMPDQVMDFRALPFPDNEFYLVVFDPPHLLNNGTSGWLAKKYGKLSDNWRKDLAAGFSECLRVLKPHGTLIFKWNEEEIMVSDILKLTDAKPLFGHKSGKNSKTHWIVFIKEAA